MHIETVQSITPFICFRCQPHHNHKTSFSAYNGRNIETQMKYFHKNISTETGTKCSVPLDNKITEANET